MTRTLTARYDGHVFIPDEPVDIPVDERVDLTVSPRPAAAIDPQSKVDDWLNPHDDGSMAAFFEWLDAQPPIEGWESPGDGSQQVDHYVYGTPKRPNP